ncbi:MAG TPA: hypothetical protein VMF14_06335 [Solirubrobacteraceae bacterium]|nr:hypothetical protein [Solirubrobacteraceae bacterium]
MPLTRADIAAQAHQLQVEGYGLYLASNGPVLAELETTPFGEALTTLDFLERSGTGSEGWSVADLMRVYNVLNATAFGEKGIPLQNWVMIDLGLLPSAFLLVTLPLARARAAADEARGYASERARTGQVLGAVLAEAERLGYAGPIPVAGYCAAPTPVPGGWVGWSLCSAIPGLGTTTKGLGLEVYRAQTLTGVAQFTDQAIRVHRKFGRMQIVSAVLDLHPVPHTLVYRTDVFSDDAERTPSTWMDSRDLEFQRAMQAKIDGGASRYYVLSPGFVDNRVPILEVTE